MIEPIIIGGIVASTGILGLSAFSGLKSKKTSKEDLSPANILNTLTGNDGLILSSKMHLSEKSCFEHALVVGPTGAGKSTTIFLTNLLSNHLPKNCSLVISDPKGELYKLTSNYQRKIGREPLLFAPLEPKHSLKYNPLEQCKSVTEVRELARTLLMNGSLAIEISTGRKSNDVVWINMAQPLWTAALLYCKEKRRPMNTIYEAYKLLLNHSNEEIDAMFETGSEDVQMQYNIFKAVAGADAAMGSIKITLSTNLQILTDPYLIETTKYSEFNFEQLREKPTALYIMYPEMRANYVSPFMGCFYSQLNDKLIEYFSPNSLSIIKLFDEFANIGQLNNFSQNIATERSRRMGNVMCLQSLTQLYQLYGEANAQSILNNCKVKLIMPGLSDIETLKYASNLCGYKDVEKKSRTESINPKKEKSYTVSYSEQRYKRYETDEIRTLDDGKVLLIAHNKPPVLDNQEIYYKHDKYLKNVKKAKLPTF